MPDKIDHAPSNATSTRVPTHSVVAISPIPMSAKGKNSVERVAMWATIFDINAN